jgi:hypothetical protein
MKQQIIYILLALTVIVGRANAQNLSVQNIEVQTSGQTELVVSLSGATKKTALQFNLQLPEGITINTNGTTLGSATDGHTFSVQTLDNGDLQFVVYSMDLKPFMDGELLHIPVSAGNTATTTRGKLYNVRTATAYAVSHTCAEVPFKVTVSDAYTLGDVNNDGSVSVTDVTMVISHILGQTPEGFNKDAADINGDGSISVTDVTMTINIILTGNTSIEERPFAYIGAGTSAQAVAVNANRTTNYGSGTQTYSNIVAAQDNYIYIILPTGTPFSGIYMSGQPGWCEQLSDTTISGVTYNVRRTYAINAGTYSIDVKYTN